MLINRYSDESEKIQKQRSKNKYSLSVRITAGLKDQDCNVYVPEALQDDIIDNTIEYLEQEITKAENELKEL